MTARLQVDPIACEAHGLCAELLPERIALDDWGYPIIDGRPVPEELLALARRAVAVCPTLALRLVASRRHADLEARRVRAGEDEAAAVGLDQRARER